jgi:hypothetical protein
MAARIRKIQHDEDTRARIKVGNIITVLQKHIDGEHDMSSTQIAAAKILLDKALPNLTSVDVKSEETRPYVIRAPSPESNVTDWLNRYGPKTIEHEPTPPKDKAN